MMMNTEKLRAEYKAAMQSSGYLEVCRFTANRGLEMIEEIDRLRDALYYIGERSEEPHIARKAREAIM